MFAHRDGDNLLVFLRLVLLQQRYWIYSALVFGHDIALSDLDGALDMAQASPPTVVMGVPGFTKSCARGCGSATATTNPPRAARRSRPRSAAASATCGPARRRPAAPSWNSSTRPGAAV